MRIYCIITYCLWTEGVCPDYREKMEKTMSGRAAKICGVLGTVGILTVLYMTGESYYSGLTGGGSQAQKETQTYQYKYDMIVDNPESSFWQAESNTTAVKNKQSNDRIFSISRPPLIIKYFQIIFILKYFMILCKSSDSA